MRCDGSAPELPFAGFVLCAEIASSMNLQVANLVTQGALCKAHRAQTREDVIA